MSELRESSAAAQLLAHIEEQSQERCRRVREEARQSADQLIAEARAQTRQRVHRAMAIDRERLQRRTVEAVSRANLARRREHNAWLQKTLDELLPRVEQALRDLWQSADARDRWIRAALKLAGERLPEKRWVLEHPPGVDPTPMLSECQAEVEMRCDPALDAGIRVSVGNVRVDATPGGLLARTDRVEGQLLALLEVSASSAVMQR